MTNRFIAIDWSGNETASGQRKHIWMAEWHDGAVNLSNERTRRETVDAVIVAARDDAPLIVGFDFSFAYPAWFAKELGCADVVELWSLVAMKGDRWLQDCKDPFWGRPKTRRPDGHYGDPWLGFRSTERSAGQRTGRLPTSTFQIGGAGAVGTGSMRGMPHLLELRRAGFSIWPFDPPRLPMAIEIYPRVFTGRTNVSSAAARAQHLEGDTFDRLPSTVLVAARNSPDAFDALCALMGMVRHTEDFAHLRQATSPDELREGAIWMPPQM